MNKRKLILIICISIIVVSFFGYIGYMEYKYPHGQFERKIDREDIVDMGLGIKTDQDTFLILNGVNLTELSIQDISAVPGCYVTFQLRKGKFKYIRGDASEQKLTYDEAKILFYNLKTKELEKTVDLMEWINRWKEEYEYLGQYGFESGGSGKIYGRFHFRVARELGEKYEFKKGLSLFIDSESGKSKVVEGGRKVDDFDPFTEEQKEKKDQIKVEIKDQNYWNQFRKENNFTEYKAFEYDSGKELKENKESYFSVEVFSEIDGVVTVDLSTISLPEKNKALYERFPELEQYRDQEWRMVRIYLGGYPTKEEIASLFVEEK
jgi:hypothetical protein